MAQKGHDSRKSKVMTGEQVRRNGPGSHKNFDRRKEQTKRKKSIIVLLMKKRWSFCKIAVGKEWRRQSHNQPGSSFHFKVLAATRDHDSRSQTNLRKTGRSSVATYWRNTIFCLETWDEGNSAWLRLIILNPFLLFFIFFFRRFIKGPFIPYFSSFSVPAQGTSQCFILYLLPLLHGHYPCVLLTKILHAFFICSHTSILPILLYLAALKLLVNYQVNTMQAESKCLISQISKPLTKHTPQPLPSTSCHNTASS